ncbi:hypothetical protein C8J56DRAFT_1123563 [Mycena floridula]|nr:hypothetical protein C8J56DRAFT_1123563 [Mycena floridula]
MTSRPKFEPEPYKGSVPALDVSWIPLIVCPSNFPPELFELAIIQLIHHPEYNSTLILRSEIVSEIEFDYDSAPQVIPKLKDLTPLRRIHRKLLARRPGRDAGLEQYCTLYTSNGEQCDTLVLTPIVAEGSTLPYYHPAVSHLAFRYVASSLQIEVIPLPGTPTDLNSRLYRTCLALLDALHRYGWGAVINYKKRVQHDCLVPRDTYQDIYLIMRERHKHLVDSWQEVTDPLKHVFEDIGIATFLMLLWKITFSDTLPHQDNANPDEPWKAWPRPPGGFVDLGCGNGLLTHILIAEGYIGHGIDLRARTSWDHYPESTRAALHVHALDPSSPSSDFLKPCVFIIGNHADELTPWVPLLSTMHGASGYLSIPCCSWTFDERYERSMKPFPFPGSDEEFFESLNLGAGSHASSYSKYRVWLASLSLHCGWKVETETLRIPSTRNWAIVGRKKTFPPDSQAASADEAAAEVSQNVQNILRSVAERGVFKTRKPEGKAGDH